MRLRHLAVESRIGLCGEPRHKRSNRAFIEANEAAGYQTIYYGADSLEGRPAARWVYLAEGDKRSDYFFTECGLGLAVVGSAPPARFSEMQQLFREVAVSARLYCGE